LDLRSRKWWETGEDCIMRSFKTCTLHQILLGYDDGIKEDETKREDDSEDVGVHGKIILERMLGK
jgi:hypothetical protein